MEDDDTARVLEQIFDERIRDTIEKFRADIPEILRRIAPTAVIAASAKTVASAPPSPSPSPSPGREFVAALLDWLAGSSRRGKQGERYLLMWHVKKMADQSRHEVPGRDEVVELFRSQLTPIELADVDRALKAKWESLSYGRSLQSFASRLRKAFVASLRPAQRERFAPYLAAFLPPFTGVGAGLDTIPQAAPAPAGSPPAMRPPATPWLASRLGSTVIVAAVPLVAAFGWFLIRGTDADARERPHPRAPIDAAPASALRSDTRASEPAVPPGPVVDAAAPRAARAIVDGPPAFAWKRHESGVSGDLHGVASSGQRAVAVGGGGTIVWSDDLTSWTASPQLPSHTYGAVTWGAGKFIAVGSNRDGTYVGRILSTSDDGVTWTPHGWQERSKLAGIAYGNGVFVAVGLQGAIVRSTDGVTWQAVPSGTGEQLDGVTYADGRFVASCSFGKVLTSFDGTGWRLTERVTPYRVNRPSYGGGLILQVGAVGEVDGVAALSSDLKTWTERELGGVPLRNVTFAKDRFVAVGPGGLFSSRDGLGWTIEVSGSEFAQEGDVTWTGSEMIAVGTHGAIYTGTKP